MQYNEAIPTKNEIVIIMYLIYLTVRLQNLTPELKLKLFGNFMTLDSITMP